MIIVKLQGGLGNQMYQYAVCKKFQSMGINVQIDDNDLNKIGNQHNGNELYRVFGIEYDRADLSECERYCKKRNIAEKIKGKIQKLFNEQWVPDVVYEEISIYDKNLLRNKNAYLNGYWQSYKYFEDIREKLLEDYTFIINKEDINNDTLNMIETSNSVAVHIRRGDYITPNNTGIYGNICTDEYYDKAIKYIFEHVIDSKLFFFSDDISWVEEKYSLYDNAQFVKTDARNSYYDMFLMSKCKHNIIANSSFSWWGAWLNRDSDKLVIAPSRWNNLIDKEEINYIIPKEWIRI